MTALPAELIAAVEDGDLVFTFDSGKTLQLHSDVACLWSKAVIKEAIASGCKRDSQGRLLLPMPGDEHRSWLFAMPFMYSHVGIGPASVSWQSARSLLLLAHKYNMPGLTSIVLAFVKNAPLGGHHAWQWLQLACNPALELPDFVTQRCINTIAADGVNWPSGQENGITMQIARQLYNKLFSNHQELAGKLAKTQVDAAAEARAAAEAAKKRQEAAVAEMKGKCSDMTSDMRWLAQQLHTWLPYIGQEHWHYDKPADWEMREMKAKLSSICCNNGLASIVGEDEGDAIGY